MRESEKKHELSKAFNANFEGNSLLEFIKIYFFFV